MRVTVIVPGPLRRFAEGRSHVEVDVDTPTVQAVFTALAADCPGVPERALDEQGRIRRHVHVFVDGDSVRHGDGLDTPVHDGSEVAIIPAVSGG